MAINTCRETFVRVNLLLSISQEHELMLPVQTLEKTLLGGWLFRCLPKFYHSSSQLYEFAVSSCPSVGYSEKRSQNKDPQHVEGGRPALSICHRGMWSPVPVSSWAQSWELKKVCFHLPSAEPKAVSFLFTPEETETPRGYVARWKSSSCCLPPMSCLLVDCHAPHSPWSFSSLWGSEATQPTLDRI